MHQHVYRVFIWDQTKSKYVRWDRLNRDFSWKIKKNWCALVPNTLWEKKEAICEIVSNLDLEAFDWIKYAFWSYTCDRHKQSIWNASINIDITITQSYLCSEWFAYTYYWTIARKDTNNNNRFKFRHDTQTHGMPSRTLCIMCAIQNRNLNQNSRFAWIFHLRVQLSVRASEHVFHIFKYSCFHLFLIHPTVRCVYRSRISCT